MLKGIFELTTTCNHLTSSEFNGHQSYKGGLPIGAPTGRSGRLAIIAIGNPLFVEDSAAIALLQLMHKKRQPGYDFCLFNFDSGFAWLKDVFLRHESVIILDSILDSTNSLDGFVTIPITPDVQNSSGFVIRATHGLSWLDEIKMIERDRTGSFIFFGVDGNFFKAGNENKRIAFLERTLRGLSEVIENCSDRKLNASMSHGGNINA